MNIRYITLSILILLSGANYLCAMEHNKSQDKSGKEEIVEENITLVCSKGSMVISKSKFENLQKVSQILQDLARDSQNQAIAKYPLPSLEVEDIALLLSITALKDGNFKEIKKNIEEFDAPKLSRLLHTADALEITTLLQAGSKVLAKKLQQPDYMADFEKSQNYIDSLQLNRNVEKEVVKQLMKAKDIYSLNRQIIDIIEGFVNLPNSYIRLIKFSPDLTKLATVAASDNNAIKIWDATTGKLLTSLEGHTDPVTSVKWNEKNYRIASCSANSTIYLWNIKSGSQIQTDSGEAWTLKDEGMSELSPKYNDSIIDLLIDLKQAPALKKIEKNGISWFTPRLKKAALYAGVLVGCYVLWKYSGTMKQGLKLFA